MRLHYSRDTALRLTVSGTGLSLCILSMKTPKKPITHSQQAGSLVNEVDFRELLKRDIMPAANILFVD